MNSPTLLSTGERIAVVDVLRAFALFGIVVTHAEMGFLAGPPPGPDFMLFGSLDATVHRWVAVLVESKFFSIFAFLFGLSFAIQLDRAGQKGRPFAGRFAWRLVLLFFIGAAHQALFNGDILMLYAVLGLLLMPLGRVRTSILLVVALLLLLNTPALLFRLAQMNAPPPTPEQLQAQEEIQAVFTAGGQALYRATESGSLGDIARTNYAHGLTMKSGYLLFTGRLWLTFGCFLLGVCAWRAKLFEDSAASRRFFGRLLVGAGVVALVTTPITMTLQPGNPLAGPWIGLAADLQKMTLAASYVAAVTLLYWRYSNGVLAQLAPLGKMGLTTYLMQSVFLALIFYGVGFGMMGKIGHAAAAGLGVLIFIAQVFMSRWWLARMSMGPVEWAWRSATQLKWQPMTRSGVAANG
jgi:uncharacterized protein